MGIYIKEMKMPKTCDDCEFLDYDTLDWEMHIACQITGEIVTYDLRNGRNEKCPLIDVPAPHGRLVDADAIDTSHSDPEVVETLNDAPTVIEAEVA